MQYIGLNIPNRDFWKKLTENWHKVMEDYMRACKDDLPYWHGERANTSFLTAAAWKMEAVAIEEYWMKRKDERGEISVGHCDLWIDSNNGRGSFSFSAEAKQLWPCYNAPANPEDFKSKIEIELSEAEGQLKSISERKKGEYSVCICFVSPRGKVKFDKDKFMGSFDDFKNKPDTILASYFPEPEPAVKWSDGYSFPGIVLIAKVLPR